MTPYLKGIHQTIDSWRPGRDKDGWKLKTRKEEELVWDEELKCLLSVASNKNAPAQVKAVPRLKADMASLLRLFEAELPPVRFVRSNKIVVAIYGFGDASGVGFGSTIQTGDGIFYRHGVWGRDGEHDSSNYRELSNLVSAIEDGLEQGELVGSELFIFTDNSTAEAVFYKGTSTNRKLFDLVLRLRRIEMAGQLRLQVIHVAGTRMISQGTDGISRGIMSEGVMAGKSMLSFVPLHQSATDRRHELLEWIRSWTGQAKLTPLSPEEWFGRGHGFLGGERNEEGVWTPKESGEDWILWMPPPAAADVAVEELNTSRHKRSHLNHVFVAPRLMTFAWRKRLQKVADVVFEIPAGARLFWPSCEHEPLIVGLTLRFSVKRPWQVKQSDCLLGVDRELREMWKDQGYDERSLLRKLCGLPGVLDAMS